MSNNHSFFMRKKKELNVSLNEVQQKAVVHTEGPLLLLASPGSGKTTTTIMRIGYLIEEVGVHPSRIKAVTFSKASAMDMKERFKRFFPSHPENSVDFSTIHSLAFAIVREYFYNSGQTYQLIEGPANLSKSLNKKYMLRTLYSELVGENITEDQLEELTTYISFIKNKMVPKENWSKIPCNVTNAVQILEEYEKRKFNGAELLLDFDDMLTIANEAFETNQTLLRKYQQRYDYILTDESQDTSLIQHSIIEKLVKPHQNLYVVADDDQSIYSWRGAEPEYLIDFKKTYSNAVILMMEQNYRSSKDIVEVANKFIKRNKNRYDKNMYTENLSHKPIFIKNFEDYRFQAKYVVKEITKAGNFQDYAILYRNNSSSVMLANECDRVGIPFYMKDTDNRFFSHWVVKDILNFMRMAFTDKRPDIFEQIRTKCNVFITKEQMLRIYRIKNDKSIFDNLLDLKDLKSSQVKQIKDCKEAFLKMKGLPPLKAIKIIREQLGYDKAIQNMSKRLGFNKEYLMGILNTLEEIAVTLFTMEEFAHRLKHLETLMHSSKYNKGQNVVTFSTFHSSKGLEFNKVFMVDLVDGVIPSSDEIKEHQDGNPKLIEEAVRLFYVGMTRAEQELELLTYKKQFGKNIKPSQFVTNVKNILIPPVQIERRVVEATTPNHSKTPLGNNPNAITTKEKLLIGLSVKHRVFGHGEIIVVDDEKIQIQFQKEKKQLSVSTCLEFGLLEPV